MASLPSLGAPTALLLTLAVAGASTACGKKGKVGFKPYSPGAVQAARSLRQPIVLYAAADW
ncbi:MAG: hypothetical protein FJ306_07180 [Planctomycetes bacterium]|nr:hypothetical protein [Planctomycetota bacterium]